MRNTDLHGATKNTEQLNLNSSKLLFDHNHQYTVNNRTIVMVEILGWDTARIQCNLEKKRGA